MRWTGTTRRSYGDAFADVYDDWYAGISDVDTTVVDLLALAGDGPVLELGVGTGRLAVPLAEAGRTAGITVTGIDTSAAMLAQLAERDTARLVHAVVGDMVDDLPHGPFALVFVAYNTLFNLTGEGASRLLPGGRRPARSRGSVRGRGFVPDHPPTQGDDVSVRTLTADHVVLSVARHDPEHQAAAGQFVELTEAGGVRLRPGRSATPRRRSSTHTPRRPGSRWSTGGRRSAGRRSTTSRPGTSACTGLRARSHERRTVPHREPTPRTR